MPRKKSEERKIGRITHEQIEEALKKIQDGGSIRSVAKEQGIPFTTLQRYYKKSQRLNPELRDVFSDEDFLPSSVTDRPNPEVSRNTDLIIENIEQVEPGTILENITNTTPSVLQEPSTSMGAGNLIMPDQFRPPLRAGPRVTKRKPRKLGRSMIATDTPEKNEIAKSKEKIQKPKQNTIKRVKRHVLQSDSEEDDSQVVFDESSEDDENWLEEDESGEDTEFILTEELLLNRNFLQRVPNEGEFIVVEFNTKKLRVFYVAKIIETRNENLEYTVSFLRMKIPSRQQFGMPDIPDIAVVKENDIKFLLPKPKISGTSRRQSLYKFEVNFSMLTMR